MVVQRGGNDKPSGKLNQLTDTAVALDTLRRVVLGSCQHREERPTDPGMDTGSNPVHGDLTSFLAWAKLDKPRQSLLLLGEMLVRAQLQESPVCPGWVTDRSAKP